MKKVWITSVLAFASICLNACSKQGEKVTFADVCQQDDGKVVAIEGFLMLPKYMNSFQDTEHKSTTYELFLNSQGDGNGQAVKTLVRGTKRNEPNTIFELSLQGYTYKDLRIVTDTGEVVGSNQIVRIVGKIERTVTGCQIKIYRIEKP